MSSFLPVLVGRAGVSFPGSGLCFFFFRSLRVSVCFFLLLLFLSFVAGVTFQLPDGRDVGSNARAPTQETVQGADPRTGFSRYHSTYVFLVYLVALVLNFVFHFVILFSVYAFSDNAISVLSGARILTGSFLEKYSPRLASHRHSGPRVEVDEQCFRSKSASKETDFLLLATVSTAVRPLLLMPNVYITRRRCPCHSV